jgi:hypothetical protein
MGDPEFAHDRYKRPPIASAVCQWLSLCVGIAAFVGGDSDVRHYASDRGIERQGVRHSQCGYSECQQIEASVEKGIVWKTYES